MLLQVRGANATGKTTAVRQYVERHSHATVRIGSVPVEMLQTDMGTVAVLGEYRGGRYDGMDTVSATNDELIAVIGGVVRSYRPAYIVFESFMRSGKWRFTQRMAACLAGLGVAYRNLVLYVPLDVAAERITRRTGRRPNEDRLVTEMKLVDNCYLKMRAAGMDVRREDTSDIKEPEMYRLVESALS